MHIDVIDRRGHIFALRIDIFPLKALIDAPPLYQKHI